MPKNLQKNRKILFILNSDQASTDRRRPRYPEFPNFLRPETRILYPRTLATNQEVRGRKLECNGTGTRASKIQDGEDLGVPRSPNDVYTM